MTVFIKQNGKDTITKTLRSLYLFMSFQKLLKREQRTEPNGPVNQNSTETTFMGVLWDYKAGL